MVNNAEQSKSGGDPKSEEPLVDGGDAQRKKLTASSDERNEMDEVMKNMRNDAAARDRSRAVIYVATGEVRYREEERAVVIPFRTYGESGGARVAAVRVVKKAQLTANSVTRIEVAIPAKDGE
ncbi:hypothetical protein PR001_g17449 [Phytophthora rubi]|uniref:Uncharacterized protein n=1 Tax=Phytophthora rubi TaxID=129364 RepID=A0A6A3KIV8_9STRA|nr:hypothetical protein PR001_g17449 [Phytophthora rubi]